MIKGRGNAVGGYNKVGFTGSLLCLVSDPPKQNQMQLMTEAV